MKSSPIEGLLERYEAELVQIFKNQDTGFGLDYSDVQKFLNLPKSQIGIVLNNSEKFVRLTSGGRYMLVEKAKERGFSSDR